MPISSYAAPSAGAKLTPHIFDPGRLGSNEVEVAVTHCGICHSDVHLIDNEWGISSYPLIAGHEIVGTVSALGKSAKDLKIGQRVGIGWQAGSCMKCEWCKAGEENLCASAQPTCLGHAGGFADKVRADARFAFPIPKAISSAEAAPLLCAGATVFTPLLDHKARRGTKLGVVSVGGLGHLALQFGRAMGCKVTAFSTSKSKTEEARRFGANRFVDLADPDQMATTANSLDLILTTAAADLPWDQLVAALRPNGTLCVLGMPQHAISVMAFPLVAGYKKIVGSNTGSRKAIEKMLAFAAKHRIVPTIERHPMTRVNEALQTVRDKSVRFRAVLEA
ncbi:MAG: NAD(P)-dependent alcohol dehydrogenase [Gemmatimonadota bacterium]|nr:NAD(P)-dependent alcohol dehydrogenase [Gemmatimonadota bacterium]